MNQAASTFRTPWLRWPQRPPRRRRSDHEANRGYLPVLAITLSIAAADWLTKASIAATIPLDGFVQVWDGRLAFWHVRNPNMILGLWSDLPLASRKIYAALSGVLAVLLLFEIVTRGHRLSPRRRWAVWLFGGFAFGGMLGNLGERAIHWGVTDFLSIGWGGVWLPPGNLADLALFCSVPLCIPVIVFELGARARRGTGRPWRAPAALTVARSPDPAS